MYESRTKQGGDRNTKRVPRWLVATGVAAALFVAADCAANQGTGKDKDKDRNCGYVNQPGTDNGEQDCNNAGGAAGDIRAAVSTAVQGAENALATPEGLLHAAGKALGAAALPPTAAEFRRLPVVQPPAAVLR
jgi:hypothetical protein